MRMTQISLSDFIIKMCIGFVPLLLAYVWITVRSFTHRGFLLSGISLEKDAVIQGKSDIREFQSNNWPVNASQVQGFSAITVAIVLLVVVFITEKTLSTWSKTYMNVIILIAGGSCLCYAFSLQFWNCALDLVPDLKWLLAQRKIATVLQSTGWHGLYLSVVLSVSFASSWCGLILSLAGAIGLILTMEMKIPKHSQ